LAPSLILRSGADNQRGARQDKDKREESAQTRHYTMVAAQTHATNTRMPGGKTAPNCRSTGGTKPLVMSASAGSASVERFKL